MIEAIQTELAHIIARRGPAPKQPRSTGEAKDIYSETRFARDRRAHALATVCYWCGYHPTDALEQEANWA